MHRHRQRVLQHAGRTWKTVKTTTGTFATRCGVFRETHHIFEHCCKKSCFLK